MSPRHHAFGPKDITVRRLASLCLAALTLTPVAAALPPVFLSPAAADPAPRPVAPRVTATAFGGVDRAAALSAPQAAAVSGRARVAALTAQLSRPAFRAVGVTWTGPTPAGTAVQVRLREKGAWSDWRSLPPADGGGPDAGTAEARGARAGTDPLLTDGADGVQVQVTTTSGSAPAGLKVQTVDPGTSAADGSAALASPAAVGVGARPTIISRAEWGADESLRNCAPTYLHSPLKAAVLHHTAGSNSYSAAGAAAEIRADYAYHTQSLGWCDLGYNFVVDRFGRIYEGRAGGVDQLVQGAHAIGVNGETFGVAALGNFDVAEPPAVMTTRDHPAGRVEARPLRHRPPGRDHAHLGRQREVRGGGADPRLRADLAPGHLVHRVSRSVPLREDGQPAQRHRRADDRDPAGASAAGAHTGADGQVRRLRRGRAADRLSRSGGDGAADGAADRPCGR